MLENLSFSARQKTLLEEDRLRENRNPEEKEKLDGGKERGGRNRDRAGKGREREKRFFRRGKYGD